MFGNGEEGGVVFNVYLAMAKKGVWPLIGKCRGMFSAVASSFHSKFGKFVVGKM